MRVPIGQNIELDRGELGCDESGLAEVAASAVTCRAAAPVPHGLFQHRHELPYIRRRLRHATGHDHLRMTIDRRLRVQASTVASMVPPSFEQETFDYKEGGVNSRLHRLPGRFKFTNVTLKKGIATDGETLWTWVEDTVRGQIHPHTVTVTLYGAV